MAAIEIRRFGIVPKVALLSHSNFGSSSEPSALKMRQVLALVQARDPSLEIDGEMHGDSALDESVRRATMPDSTLSGSANLLVMPNIDAANIAYNLLKTAAGNGVAIGPILLGCNGSAHILTPSTTVRRIVNIATLAVVEANAVVAL
jgi:malate dehydrogenase (oxaloacetate-decarboxylating)(NADP+)